MANRNQRNTIFIARHIVPIFFSIVIILIITNTIIVLISINMLLKSRSAMCETSRVAECDVEAVKQVEIEQQFDEATYNITSNKYSYAYCSNKHCVQMGNAIYFQGEVTPYGKLLTATPSRLICEISPTEYNVVYRIY